MMGSIMSSGIRTNLLFCMFSVSREFRFSNAMAGNILMLTGKTAKQIQISVHYHLAIVSYGKYMSLSRTYSFFCKLRNVMESP